MKKQKILAQLSMVVTTMIWGITFVMVKDALNDAPPYMFAALRFGIAFILGLVYVNKGIKKITDHEMLGGLLCGFCLFDGWPYYKCIINCSFKKYPRQENSCVVFIVNCFYVNFIWLSL